jgi:dienelactone hydrolase
MVHNHGGFAGIGAEWTAPQSLCREAARNGLVVMQSSYRGEDGSDGQVEICAGEVDDVAAMLAIVRAQPYAVSDRVVAFGGSHGGCITARLALRDPSLRAVAQWFGPSDFPLIYRSWDEQIAAGEPSPSCAGAQDSCRDIHACLLTLVENSLGGTPAGMAAAYRARSWVNDLAALKVPMLIVHGTIDNLVPLEQSCVVRSALTGAGRSLHAWYLDRTLAVQNPPAVCGGDFRTEPIPSGSAPGTWSAASVYFFVLEDQGHGFTGAAATFAGTAALSFLASHL